MFDPAYGEPVLTPQWLRGVSYWTDGVERRILFSFRNHLYAVDADSGRAILSFGSGGRVARRPCASVARRPNIPSLR
jgi:quinoprotein glucose dehydrogenase